MEQLKRNLKTSKVLKHYYAYMKNGQIKINVKFLNCDFT